MSLCQELLLSFCHGNKSSKWMMKFHTISNREEKNKHKVPVVSAKKDSRKMCMHFAFCNKITVTECTVSLLYDFNSAFSLCVLGCRQNNLF
jgi:hypothetical protein